MNKLSTYFVLFAEFGSAHVPVELVGERFFQYKPDYSKRLASERKFPVMTFQAGYEKSPWLVDIADLAMYINEKASQDMMELDTRILEMETELRYMQKANLQICNIKQVPVGEIVPSSSGQGLPETSGIYFLYSGPIVVYIGKSKNLKARLKLNVHHTMQKDDMISFIEVDEDELDFTESLYIGLLRPIRNFSKSKNHRKYAIVD